jgi:FlaA1/EpsC-like NDP-sugar epimerase
MDFTGCSMLVTGGTGSLGSAVVSELLSGRQCMPRRIVVFSRDEEKQYRMRMKLNNATAATHDILYSAGSAKVEFRIGDVRDYASLSSALHGIDIVIHAAAMKQVPTCEFFPTEAARTNILGAENIVRAIREQRLNVLRVVGLSTDKACKPVNVLGFTKALQERIFTYGNLECPNTRFASVRYGNVLESRGSVVPLFREQVSRGGPVTLTSRHMTRFLFPLSHAVQSVLDTVRLADAGDIFVPKLRSARMEDLARILIGDRHIPIIESGVRPGEKLHESLVAEEECSRTVDQKGYLVMKPMLPGIGATVSAPALTTEYSSKDCVMTRSELQGLLADYCGSKEEPAC